MLSINNLLLTQLLYLSLAAVTAYQKISGAAVPEWFIKKFEPSIFGMIPFGVAAAFWIIALLEAAIAIVFLVSIFKMEFRAALPKTWLSFGFDLSMLLFLILFFGSFLVGDYSNGAFDFMYFAATFFLKKELVKTEK
jgi:hypothetical protein